MHFELKGVCFVYRGLRQLLEVTIIDWNVIYTGQANPNGVGWVAKMHIEIT